MTIGQRLGWALLFASVTVAQSKGQNEAQAQGASNPQKDVERARKLQEMVEEARVGAERGEANRQANLAFYYQYGLGVKKDESQAATWYSKAAEQGHAGAQFQLGAMYADGEGVPQDFAQAVHWYRKAAEQAEVTAQVRLAEMYDRGKGVPQDYTESARWYREAAERGNGEAQIVLSGKYEFGRGVPQSYVMAHMWINIATSRIPGGPISDELHRKTAEIRDRVAAKMTAAQIAEAQRLAREWKPTDKSATQSPSR